MNKFSRVLIAEEKLIDYLLNPAHKKGGAQARFFISTCGFSPDNPRALEDELRKHPLTAEPGEPREAEDGEGMNYPFTCDIQTPNRGPTCILSVWCIGDEGSTPHFVTARPLRGKELSSRAG